MRGVEILEVVLDDPAWFRYAIEGNVLYSVKYRDTDGLLYWQRIWAKDELDAAMQVMTGTYNEINTEIMEQTDDGPDGAQTKARED